MSNIPAARTQVELALGMVKTEKHLHIAQSLLERALGNMTRKPAVRKARQERVYIDEHKREQIRNIAEENPSLTMHEIASITGVRSSGRVSEVLNGLR